MSGENQNSDAQIAISQSENQMKPAPSAEEKKPESKLAVEKLTVEEKVNTILGILAQFKSKIEAQDQAIKFLAQTLDEITKAISQKPQTPPSPSNPSTPLNPIDPGLAGILGGIMNMLGGGGEIIPAEMQKQIVANMIANALNPPDRFSDFLKGFNMAIRTLALLTKGGKAARRLEKMFPVEEEAK